MVVDFPVAYKLCPFLLVHLRERERESWVFFLARERAGFFFSARERAGFDGVALGNF